MKKNVGLLLIFVSSLSVANDGQKDIPATKSQPVPVQKTVAPVPINRKPSWREKVEVMHNQNPWKFKQNVGLSILCACHIAYKGYVLGSKSKDEIFEKIKWQLLSLSMLVGDLGKTYYNTEVPIANPETESMANDGQGDIPKVELQHIPVQKTGAPVPINRKPSWRETVKAMHNQNPWNVRITVGSSILNVCFMTYLGYVSKSKDEIFEKIKPHLLSTSFMVSYLGKMYYDTEVPIANPETDNSNSNNTTSETK